MELLKKKAPMQRCREWVDSVADQSLPSTNREKLTERGTVLCKINVKDSKGRHLGTLKIRGHHALGRGIAKICNFVKASPHHVQMMTIDGRVASHSSCIYELFPDCEPFELILISRKPSKRENLRRLQTSKVLRRVTRTATRRKNAICSYYP